MPWQPPSVRDDPAALARLAEPVEGIPPWLKEPILQWLARAMGDSNARAALLREFQIDMRLTEPFNWGRIGSAYQDAMNRVRRSDEFAIDLIDFILFHAPGRLRDDVRNHLDAQLHFGGSVWQVVAAGEPGRYQLVRRAVGPIRETIEALPADARAAQHLITAWNRLSGREPDVSVAYREAIRAVEAAAKATILPDDGLATMGRMIAALRDKPEKWTTRIGTVETVRLMMESVWQGQLDRHGTDDESVPLNVSAEQADAAVTTCVTLVRLFVGGHVQRVTK